MAQVIDASLTVSAPRSKLGAFAGWRTLYAAQIAPRLGRKRIVALTSQEVEKWIGDLIALGLDSNTYYVALNKVSRWAMWRRLIAHNPFEAVELPNSTL